MLRILALAVFFSSFVHTAFGQLSANAGNDKIVCPGASVTLGGSPAGFGGKPPFTYSWSPSTALSSATSPNPIASPASDISYTLTVTDDTGAVATDQVLLVISPIKYVNAGNDTSICENSFAQLGNPVNTNSFGLTYTWKPGATLNDSTAPRPISSPGVTSVTYTLTVSIPGCPSKIDFVTVSVIPTPDIDAGYDTTIQEGETAILNASGGFNYAWSPTATLTYPWTAHPDAEPILTTTYYLYGTDGTGKCPSYDSVTVFVEKSDALVFYNTFTPNGDGNNDTWYIGNVHKYPDNELQIFNRNGKIVLQAYNYQNTWDGTNFGEELPSATYYFVFDPGDGSEKKKGTVTIVR